MGGMCHRFFKAKTPLNSDPVFQSAATLQFPLSMFFQTLSQQYQNVVLSNCGLGKRNGGDGGALYVLSHEVLVALVDQVNGYQDISEIERFLLAGRFWQCFLVLVNVMIDNNLFLVIVLVIEYRAITGKLNILLCFCNFITHD